MRGINKVILVGNLGNDPEKYGDSIASFSVATTDTWKDKESGERREKTEWHRIKAFGKLGEICLTWLKKGSQVYIEGSLRTSEYEKDGVKRYSTEIILDDMKMLGSKSEPKGEVSERPKKEIQFDDDIPF